MKIPWLVTNVILWRRTTYGTIRLSRCAAGKNNWFAWNLDGKSVSLCQWKTFLFCSSRQLPLLRAFWADALFNDHRLASCVAPEFQRIKDTVSCNVLGGGPRTLSRTTYYANLDLGWLGQMIIWVNWFDLGWVKLDLDLWQNSLKIHSFLPF